MSGLLIGSHDVHFGVCTCFHHSLSLPLHTTHIHARTHTRARARTHTHARAHTMYDLHQRVRFTQGNHTTATTTSHHTHILTDARTRARAHIPGTLSVNAFDSHSVITPPSPPSSLSLHTAYIHTHTMYGLRQRVRFTHGNNTTVTTSTVTHTHILCTHTHARIPCTLSTNTFDSLPLHITNMRANTHVHTYAHTRTHTFTHTLQIRLSVMLVTCCRFQLHLRTK